LSAAALQFFFSRSTSSPWSCSPTGTSIFWKPSCPLSRRLNPD
jgi:hypothetical protein